MVLNICEGLHWIGALDPELRVFDIIMHTEKGTTYNSYLIQAEKTAVVDAVKERFAEEYLENIRSLTDPKDIDYIVVNHTEPDHSGAIVHLLEEAPNAVVICSQAGYNFLRQLINKDFDYEIVKEGDTLDLGGKTLKFLSVPLLHWPDTIFTYLAEDKVLLSCDGFGAHYCHEKMFNDLVGDFSEQFKYYFEMIMGPFMPMVLDAVKKAHGLEIEIICPSHGPIHRDNPMQYVDLYEKWSTPAPKGDEKKLLIAYVSAHGLTEKIAKAVSEGAAEVPKVDVDLVEISGADRGELADKVNKADGLLIGSPTIVSNIVAPVMELLNGINPVVHRGKKAGAFGSYGWSGEAVPMIIERLKSLRLSVVEPGMRVNFAPSSEDLEEAREFGRSFAAKL